MTSSRASKTGDEEDLKALARLYGAEMEYVDASGKRREVSPTSILQILKILGAPLGGQGDIHEALRLRQEEPWRRALEPVTVVWDGQPTGLTVRLPAREAEGRLRGRLHLEEGAPIDQEWKLGGLPTEASLSLGGVAYVSKRLAWSDPLPWGCHRLVLELAGGPRETLIISAPSRSYVPPSLDEKRPWGVFLPLYALHSETSWGAGDFADLRRLQDWVGGQGGSVVATLPMLAAFLDEPCEPSPYSPVSRLFWNEFYLDVAAAPELATCPTARALLGSVEFTREIEALRALPLVDYRRQMALKRKVLMELSRSFSAGSSGRQATFERFLTEHPQADDYARFRAAGERFGHPWTQWAAAQRGGVLSEGDYDEEARQYHLYVQWLAEEQIAGLAAGQAGLGLYLDLPLGVHAHGYDVWRERTSFAMEASGGCPPDLVFPKGQDWGFPPLHPEGIRSDGYRYVRAYVRQQMKYAGVLRIDHMPVFHRLWWVPRGMEASEGVYVRYPTEELYALFSLESHRHRTMLVGEDLGTVPPEVPESMAQHDVHRMYVLQYALTPNPEEGVPPPPASSVASLNTHDMPPFTAFLEGADVAERDRLGLLGGQDPAVELEARRKLVEALRHFLQKRGNKIDKADDAALLRASLLQLASSDARLFLVNLEDLWRETQAQNIPSSADRHPNWQRKARFALEQFDSLPGLRDLLREVSAARQGGPSGRDAS